MSEPKLISPLLDNYLMGDPISDHHGVRCCPAIIKNTDNRFIVKIISIPASQVQLDALLLAGAYSSQASALAYFKELAAGVAEEAEILKKLSKFEGFVPYDGLQIVPMEGKVGYDVYLLSPYKRSLERILRKGAMTHLKAVNLGLDLCAAMVMCRRAGFLYVDLKPGNIFVNAKNEYCVGDLGFVRISSLKYASLPDKYRSAYTAPELSDAMASINETVDTFAIGMILHQIFNDNTLPQVNEDGTWPAPIHADPEIAEIILKAIHSDPSQRWQDPMQMGQALVSYMQRNTVNDIPIGQVIPEEPVAQEEVQATEEQHADAAADAETGADAAVTEKVPETEDLRQENTREDTAEEAAQEEPVAEEVIPEEPVQDEPVSEDPVPEASDEEEIPAVIPCPVPDAAEDTAAPEAPAADPAEPEAALPETEESAEDELPDVNPEEINYQELSNETSDMLAQADELLALEIPEPVVAPQPVEIPIPEPIVLEQEEPQQEPETTAEAEPEEPAEEPEETPSAEESPEPETPAEETPVAAVAEAPVAAEKPKKKLPIGKIAAIIILILLLLGAAIAGNYYYNNIYIQTVDSLEIQGTQNSLTVLIDTEAEENLLSVLCSDSYGNTRIANFTNGKAVFNDLNPDTIYKITVRIDGFHELTGKISETYTTPAQTNILQFEATAGSESGSVILTFAVDGQDTKNWTVAYSAEGENEQTVSFSGHIVTINSLIPGKEYTFTLSSTDELYIVGKNTVTFTASMPIYAQDLTITSCTSEGLVVVWNAPEGITVDKWIVRCYNDSGFDQTIETADLTTTFTGINPSDAFTVEVLADGMSLGVRTYLSARSATITNVTTDTSVPLTLTVNWDITGTAPVGGWIVIYSREGGDQQELIRTTENSVTISPAMPYATYVFTVQSADGTTVVDGNFSAWSGGVETFNGYGVTADNMVFHMCKPPSFSNWKWYDVPGANYKYTYAPGEKAAIIGDLNRTYETSYDIIEVTYLIRDNRNNLVASYTVSSTWSTMWTQGHCGLDIGPMPETPGNYTLAVYFNGMAACQMEFTVK